MPIRVGAKAAGDEPRATKDHKVDLEGGKGGTG